MNIIEVKIGDVKANTSNPRIIKDDKFTKLVQSIKDFPEMLKLRPIVVDENMMVLGGNMRLRASKDAGLKKVHIIMASELTPEQQKQFIIKDNISFGQWDWDILANEFDSGELNEWGLDVWTEPSDDDYPIIDDDIADTDSESSSDSKKTISIEFEPEHLKQAQKLIQLWKDKGLYVGGFIIEKLKEQKLKS
jgi:hypothetical protein